MSEGGSVSPTSQLVDAGGNITLTATANDKYTFTNWEIISGSENADHSSLTSPDLTLIEIAGDVSVKANFAKKTISLTLVADGSGKVYLNGEAFTSAVNLNEEATVTVKAEGNVGYVLDHWAITDEDGNGQAYFGNTEGTKESTSAEVELHTHKKNIEVTAYFVPCTHADAEPIDGQPATCTEEGKKVSYFCDVCQKLFIKDGERWIEVTDDSDLVIPAHLDEVEDLVAEVPATCTEDGMEAHYFCEECGKYFDADMEPSTLVALTISALGHNYAPVEGLAPTTEKPGYLSYYQCDRDCCQETPVYSSDTNDTFIENIEAWKALGGDGFLPALYVITKGNNSKWYVNDTNTLPFTCTALFADFQQCNGYVWVDGKLVDPSNYTATAGSTNIELHTNYLNALTVGRHTITIGTDYGYATAFFTVAMRTPVPLTGDSVNLFPVILMSLFALAGAAYVVYRNYYLDILRFVRSHFAA